jgi:hypothetical protein
LIKGNDLARCLRWGGGYEGESISKLLEKISRSEVVMMDRWNVSIEATGDKEEPVIPSHKVLKVRSYFTILWLLNKLSQSLLIGYTLGKCSSGN